jgi:uncharacterized repeat protein (TIGR01451 family)
MKTKLLPLLLFTFATNAFAALDTPTEDFIDNNDGTVTHKKTGLTWQRCVVGQTWTGSSCSGTALTFTEEKALIQTSNFAGKNDWRVPTNDELVSIFESGNLCCGHINLEVFPNSPHTSYEGFWSSTYYNYQFHFLYYVMLGNQASTGMYTDGRNNYFSVRLVRGIWGDPLPSISPSIPTVTTTAISIATTIDLSTTLSQSSSRVKINENLTYTATVINNGTGTANNSLLKMYLPPRNVSVVSMPSDCVTTGKSITCSLGNLAAGANTSRTITVNYIKSGGASLSSLVLTDSSDTNSANNVSRVVTAIKK